MSNIMRHDSPIGPDLFLHVTGAAQPGSGREVSSAGSAASCREPGSPAVDSMWTGSRGAGGAVITASGRRLLVLAGNAGSC
jgi:hypothetical protein